MNKHSNPGFVLNFVPTGLMPNKTETPSLPVSNDEIVEQVHEMAELGVNMVHLHTRDPDNQRHSPDKQHYARLISAIREHVPELIICVTTSGRGARSLQQRAEVLELDGDQKPDFASLSLGSLNFSHGASVNDPQTIQALAQQMLKRGIRPELEAFDLGMLNYANYLIGKGLLRPPYYFNLILGGVAGAQAELMHLGLMTRELPAGAQWSAGGIGRYQLTANALALAAGGGVRVGLEDNVWLDQARRRPASNRELVMRVLRLAETLERTPYSRADTRALLGLSASPATRSRPVGGLLHE